MPPQPAQLRRLAAWLGVFVAAVGLLVVIGWMLGFDPLRFARPMPFPIKANAGLCLFFAGLSLALQHDGRFVRSARACAGVVIAIGLVTLLERVVGFNAGIDELLARDPAPSPGSVAGRMTWRTSAAMIAIGFALFSLRPGGRRTLRFAPWLAKAVVTVCLASLVALGLHLPTVSQPQLFGFQISVALILLGAGVLLAHPTDRVIPMLVATGTAGAVARRLFFSAAIIPTFVAAIFVMIVRREMLPISEAAFLITFALVLTTFGVALFSIRETADIQEGREGAEQAREQLTARLQQQAAELQETVEIRTRELRETNARLRATAESNALLALVAQNTANGVVICDADGRIEWVNAAFEAMTGWPLPEVKGRRPKDFIVAPETDAEALASLQRAREQGEPCQRELLGIRKDGARFWHRVDLQPVRDRGGQLVNFVLNDTDITSQRADQQRLRQLNSRLELAHRAAELGVWEWNAVTQRSDWDDRVLAIYGLRHEQFQGTLEDWVKRLHPEDRESAVAAVQAGMRNGATLEHAYRIIRANDSAVRWVQSRALIQRDEQGRPTLITGTERDVTDERAAARELETLNERLRLALRSSNFGVWEIDIGSGRHHWDGRMLEIHGLSAETFAGLDCDGTRLIHPDDRARAIDRVQHVIDGALGRYDDVYRVVRPDGVLRHIESHGYLQRGPSGRAVRLVGLTRDVTEQKLLEQALELAEQRWQLAIEGSNDSAWDWNVSNGLVYHDDRWAHMLGYQPSEIDPTIEGWKALAHPDDLPANEAAIAQHFSGATPFYQHELRMRAKDGSWRWILDRGRIVRRGPDGQPIRMAGTHSDITERKELEERLKKSEELASEVSRLAQIGAWEIDLITHKVTWTEGTRRIHEVTDTFEPTLEGVWQFFPPDALITVQRALNQVTPASPSFDLEVPLLTARGRRAWVRMLGHSEFRQGKPASVHGAIQDVTAQHENEEARRELEGQLFQAQKMETLGTLAGGIAHDFNNLLTGIIGYHELAADSLPEEHPARMCLGEARNASLRARELVEQILTFGRQHGATEHASIDLALVIEEARRFLRATLPANITIDVQCAPHCPPVLADATQIHQVLLNLGSNAAHAMRHQGGTLRIALEPTEVTADLALALAGPAASSYVRLTVSDTGHGMDEPTRRRIFDPFFTTKNTREGTGLGLAVVHGIVRSHRGAINVESTPGKGTTFHIYLPIAAGDNADNGATSDASPRGHGEYVCVVDDEEVVGSCTKLVLENKGYRTLIFSSAEHCLAEMENSVARCAVLVTDQTMPGMQGTELAAALRRLNPSLPVVIMSGYFSKIPPQALDELGQIELLAKPFTTDELALAVHRALHPTERAGIAAGV